MNAIPKNVKRRIASLQAMAADTSSENEAMAAARRLHALLAQYGSAALDIEDDGSDIDKESYLVDHEKLGNWSGWVVDAIAQLYFCKSYQYSTVGKGKERTRRHVVTGAANYRITAMIMIRSVIDAIHHESKMASATDRPFGEDGWSFICSFRKGAGSRVHARCMELIALAKAGELVDEDTGRNLPVLLSMYEQNSMDIDQYFADQGIELGKSKQARSSANSMAGQASGRAFGNRVGLQQGIAAECKARLLL